MSRWTTDGWTVQAPKLQGEGPFEARVTYHEDSRSAAFECGVLGDGTKVICFGNSARWEIDHPWFAFRRDEIMGRVAQSVLEPGLVAEFSDTKGITFAHIRKQASVV
jgi:hypothetical protein